MILPKEDTTKKRRVRICPECKSPHLLAQRDENCTVCLDCGFVISAQTTKQNSERKSCTNNQQEKARQTSHFVKAKLSTDNEGNSHEKMARALEQWKDVKVWDSTERNLAIALQFTTKIAIDLSLPRITLEKASLAYKKIIENGLLKGRSMRTVCAIAVYIGCKQCKTAITINDVARASKINPRKIYHSYKRITKHFDFSIQPTRTSNHVVELSARLQLTPPTTEVLGKIIAVIDSSKGFVGKSPTGVAAAAIYISSLLAGEKRTQREIAEVARITEATIRSRCRDIENKFAFSLCL
jgi:transcription initiation factor TFIIB